MDLKGQQLSERIFQVLMWTVTILAALFTFISDDVMVMFFTFSGGLLLSVLVRPLALPSMPT